MEEQVICLENTYIKLSSSRAQFFLIQKETGLLSKGQI